MQRVLITLLFSLLLMTSGLAQTSSTLMGTVFDPKGAVVPNVKITAKHLETSATRHLTSDGLGRYTFAEMRVGTYELSAELKGFKSLTRSGIILSVSETTTLNLSLEVAGVTAGGEIIAAGSRKRCLGTGKAAGRQARIGMSCSPQRRLDRPLGRRQMVVSHRA